jgi:hypothetical protein
MTDFTILTRNGTLSDKFWPLGADARPQSASIYGCDVPLDTVVSIETLSLRALYKLVFRPAPQSSVGVGSAINARALSGITTSLV